MPFKNSHKTIAFSASLIVLLVFAACKHEKDPLSQYGTFVKTVLRKESGAFRGFNFGEQMDSVIAKEAGPAAEADQDYLYYEYKIDSLGSFNITYDFDERGLNEIQSDIYITNANQSDSVFNSFKSYFDDHFGTEETDMGYNVWSVKSDKFGDVKINLTDQSAGFTTDGSPGKIAISIYTDKD